MAQGHLRAQRVAWHRATTRTSRLRQAEAEPSLARMPASRGADVGALYRVFDDQMDERVDRRRVEWRLHGLQRQAAVLTVSTHSLAGMRALTDWRNGRA